MGAVIEFPCMSRVAANDANPWLSSEPLPEVEPVETESRPEPVYAVPREKTDEITGITYTTYVMPDEPPEKKSHWKIWCFLIGACLGFGTF